MAGKPVAENIGQDRANPNPEDAVRSSEGTYKDAVNEAPISERLQEKLMPKAPDPTPFVTR